MSKEVEMMNMWLERDYGYFEATYPLFRISWSEDQIEKRIVKQNDWGIDLIHPVVMEKPKYKQWLRNKFVLERLIPVPPIADLVDKISYEPIWVFENKNGEALPPNYEVCKIVILSMYCQMAKMQGVKYVDPRLDPDFKEKDRARLDALKEELFGNETDVTDALAAGSGVGYTGDKK